MMRQKLVDEEANRKALEVKKRAREEEEFKIKQEEKMLELKMELTQA